MTSIEIESWTLRAVETALAGHHPEDSFVEFKREFASDHNKSARRLAALANAARGEPVLWLVGVDEKQRLVTGASGIDLSDWWAGVSGQFNEIVPTMRNLSVAVGESAVQALVFETDRAPFVVKNVAGGAVSLEVPWREGTRVNSARRSDLIGMLAPLVRLPDFEILGARFMTTLVNNVAYRAEVTIRLYVSPRDAQRVVFPFHKMRMEYEVENAIHRVPGLSVFVPHNMVQGHFGVENRPSTTITESSSEVIVDGPGRFEVRGGGDIPAGPQADRSLRVSVALVPASSTKAAVMTAELTPTSVSPPYTVWELRGR